MKCPKCSGDVSAVKINDIEFERCHVCEGLWFEPGELENLLENYSDTLRKINFKTGIFDGQEGLCHKTNYGAKKGECPVCGKAMERKEQDDIVIDVCSGGHGVWLDGGEILCMAKERKMNFLDIFKYIFSKERFKGIFGRAGK